MESGDVSFFPCMLQGASNCPEDGQRGLEAPSLRI